MKRSNSRNESSEWDVVLRKQSSSFLKLGKNSESAETELCKRTAPGAEYSHQGHTVDNSTLSTEAIHSTTDALEDDDSQSHVASEISSLASNRSHESLSFIRGKALYNLVQEVHVLVDEMDLGDVVNEKEGLMISGSVSDDDLDNLQRELANADQEFGDMFDWDGKSIIVVEAESDSSGKDGITDIPSQTDRASLTEIESSSDFQPQSGAEPQDTNHLTLISLDESTACQKEEASNTKARHSQHSNVTRMESSDLQPPAQSEQEHEIHLAPVSLKESTEGLQEEEYGRSRQQSKPAFRQLEEILALVQEENRALKSEMDQIQQSRTKEEAEYDKNLQEVEEKVLVLMTRLRDKQMQYTAAMNQARDDRASLEQQLQEKEEQIQQLYTRYQQKSKEEKSRRQKLEKALDTVQKDLERVDSVTSDMVQELDDASSMGGNSHSLSKWRDTDSWSAASPKKANPLRKDSPLSGVGVDKIPDALTINHVLHMCQSPPKVSRLSTKSFDTTARPDMVDEIKMRNEKAAQVLTELKTKARHNNKKGSEEESKSIALDYGQAEPELVNANIQDLNGNQDMLLSQFDEESDLLNKQLSVQREIIARLETKQKTMMESSRQRYGYYESEMSELKAAYDEQLATFANENESLNQKLVNVTTTIDQIKSRHKKEISSLKLERCEIEKELMESSVAVSNTDFERSQQENEALSRHLVQYNEAMDKLRSRHEQEMKAHEVSQTFLVQELKKLQSKYESTVGSFYRQKEILMKKLIEKERAISEIEVAQERKLKSNQEEKQRLEGQLQALDERCIKMKKDRAELLQAQKQKFELLSLQLKGLKAMRDMERNNAERRINMMEEKLETMSQKKLVYSSLKSDEGSVEASDTSRSSCLDPMADEDDKVRETRLFATAFAKLPRQSSSVGTKRTIALLLAILIIWASIQRIQSGIEERDLLNRKIVALETDVNKWKLQDTANDAMKAELLHSLDEATSESMGHKKEALTLADQLDQLLAKYEALQQQHVDYLDSYSQETSHDPLPRCFDSPTLSLVASLEAQLEDMIEQHGNTDMQVQPLDAATPLLEDGLSEEEERSGIQEESALPVMGTRELVVVRENDSVKLMDSQATVFELSKAGLEAELFLVENLAMLQQMEGFFEKERMHDLLCLLRQGASVLQDDVKTKASLFSGAAVTLVEDKVTQLKAKLLPQHRRLIKSEEGVWLDL
mmetsp:Transcript_42211/g.101967  ORF Transcript_42211/g.101967 Transcript_42211/m.101967 type:complete len:1208 (+) Transcript_42211:51-3674(+)